MGNHSLLTLLAVSVLLGASRTTSAAEHAPLVCPSGAKVQVLEGKNGRIEYCAKGKILHGPAREWYPNGGQRTADNWSEGVKVGLWVVWDEKGTKREERCFFESKLDGRETRWHANGRVDSITHYQAGMKHGSIAQWDHAGKQIAAGQFENDRAEGTWTFRRPEDGAAFEVVFNHGDKQTSSPIAQGEFREWKASEAACPARGLPPR
jgi:hypothetical protein